MPGWRIALWVALVLAAVLFLYLVRGILLPFLVSFVIASILEPSVRRLRHRGLSRRAAVSAVMAVFFGIVVGAGLLITPTITRETQALTDRVQDLTASLSRADDSDNFFLRWDPMVRQGPSGPTNQIDRVLVEFGPTLERLGLPSTRREIMEQYVDKNRPQIARAVQKFSNSAFGILTNLFSQILFVVIVPILVPLILMEFDDWRQRGPRWIPPSIRTSTVAMLSDIGQVFFRYLRGISTVVLLYAAVMTAFLWAAGVPSWVLLGPLFGALYLVPYIGNIISALTVFSVVGLGHVTGGLVHPVASPWAYALIVTLLYLAIGFAFDHLIYPQMVGNSVGLSPVVSMFVIFCGGALFGLPGMLIAFPLAGSVKVVLDRLLRVTTGASETLALPAVPLRHRST